MENNVLFALGLTLFAGLSTGIGSLIGFMSKQFNPRFLTIALGFSAGVMIYVSMIEIFVKARDSLAVSFGGFGRRGSREEIISAVRQQALDGNIQAAKLLLSEYEQDEDNGEEEVTVERAIELIREWNREKFCSECPHLPPDTPQ